MDKTRSIVLGGLLAAIHLVAVFVVEFIPGLDLILIFALPFFSVMYVIKCKPVYVLTYAIATFLLSLVFNPPVALLYILPALMVGITYGYLVKNKTSNLTLVYLLTAVQIGTFFLSCVFIKIIYGIDLVDSLQKFFNLDLNANNYLGLPFLILYCFAQAFLIHIILKGQLKKLRIKLEKTQFPPMWIGIVEILLLLALFSSLVDKSHILAVSLGSIVFGLPFVLYAFQIFNKPTLLFILVAVFFLVIALPLTTIYKDTSSALPFIAMFVPVIGYGMWKAFQQTDFYKN